MESPKEIISFSEDVGASVIFAFSTYVATCMYLYIYEYIYIYMSIPFLSCCCAVPWLLSATGLPTISRQQIASRIGDRCSTVRGYQNVLKVTP